MLCDPRDRRDYVPSSEVIATARARGELGPPCPSRSIPYWRDDLEPAPRLPRRPSADGMHIVPGPVAVDVVTGRRFDAISLPHASHAGEEVIPGALEGGPAPIPAVAGPEAGAGQTRPARAARGVRR